MWRTHATMAGALLSAAFVGVVFGVMLAPRVAAHLLVIVPAAAAPAAVPELPTTNLHSIRVPPKHSEGSDAACHWTPQELDFEIRKPRPAGPRSAYHCDPREGPPLPVASRAKIQNETVSKFVKEFDALFKQTSELRTGGNPTFQCTGNCADGEWTEHWGAAFASVDGHMHSVGYDGYISLMSQSKIVAYMLALQLLGTETVEKYVSAEPSGRSFGDFATMKDHRAFNPYVSTGAEIIWALLDDVAPGQYRETIDLNRKAWEQLSAGAGAPVMMRTGHGELKVPCAPEQIEAAFL